jgi:hypothetical protein
MSPKTPEPSPSEPGSNIDIAALSATAYENLRPLARARTRSSAPMTLLNTSGEKSAGRRGEGAQKITLTTGIGDSLPPGDEPLCVDDALADPAKVEPRLAQVGARTAPSYVVECRPSVPCPP